MNSSKAKSGYYMKRKFKEPILVNFKEEELTIYQLINNLNTNTDMRNLIIENPILFLEHGNDILSYFNIISKK